MTESIELHVAVPLVPPYSEAEVREELRRILTEAYTASDWSAAPDSTVPVVNFPQALPQVGDPALIAAWIAIGVASIDALAGVLSYLQSLRVQRRLGQVAPTGVSLEVKVGDKTVKVENSNVEAAIDVAMEECRVRIGGQKRR